MQIGMRQYDQETVDWFRQVVARGETTRTQLASQLCERLDWRNAKGELCESSARKVLPMGAVPSALGDWTTREFGGNGLTDDRLRQRLIEKGRCWKRRAGAEIFADRTGQRAADQLLPNARVSMADMLAGHQGMTVQRAREADETVLVVQDTTVLNYQTLQDSTDGLMLIGRRRGGSGSVGVVAHVLLALTETGQPLGLLDLEADFRAPGKKTGRRAAGVKKESGRWLRGFERTAELGRAGVEKRVVTVCDREADLWALYVRQAAEPAAGLLVRVGSRRRVQVGDETPLLEDYMASLPPCATTTVAVQASGGAHVRGHRTVSVNLQIARVRVCAPRGEEPAHLVLTAVRVSEATPPGKSHQPLHWLLLCSEGETTAEWARRIQGWYQNRWSVEEYFRVLKTGIRIEEDRYLDATDDLRKYLVLDAIAAWQVFTLQRAARLQPEQPAEQFVTGEQIEALYASLRQVRVRIQPPRERPLDIRTFVIDAARFAGFHPSRGQPLPGAQKLWSGLRYLQWALIGYQAAVEDESCEPH